MQQILDFLAEFNVWTVIIRTALAIIMGGVIGLERGKQGRAAGMRTHILVCLGAALTAMIGFYLYYGLGVSTDPMRISAQVISGIGFLGVGTIMLKGRFQVVGLTTAAGLWVTAAMGLSLGAGFYEGAVIAFLISVFTVMVLNKIERFINNHRSFFGVYIEIDTDADIKDCLHYLKEKYGAYDVQVTVPRSGVTGNVGVEVSVMVDRKSGRNLASVIKELEEIEYVIFATESL